MALSKPTPKYMMRRQEAQDGIRWRSIRRNTCFPNDETDETEQTQKRPLTRLAFGFGGRNCLHRRNCLLD